MSLIRSWLTLISQPFDTAYFKGRLGNSSVRTHYLLRSGDALAAEGYAVSVWVDSNTQRPIPLPEAARKLAIC